jgi:hypothetical protein
MSRVMLPRRISSSFAANTSICQFHRNRVCGLTSWKQRWMKAGKSCRNIASYSAGVMIGSVAIGSLTGLLHW